MTRLTLLAVVLLVASALSLVSAQYRARQLFIDLDQAKAAARKLDIEWRGLQVDQTNFSKNSLIEATAERDLKMQRPTPRRMQFMTLPDRPLIHLRTTPGDVVTKDVVTKDVPLKDAP